MRTNACLIPNPNHETRKTRIKTWHVQEKNPNFFNYNNKIIIKQSYDKKTYPKLVLNKLKVIKNSIFI